MSSPGTNKSPDCECVDCKCVDCTCTKGECKCPGCDGNAAEAAAPQAEAGKKCCGCEKPADCGTCTSGGCSCGDSCKCCT